MFQACAQYTEVCGIVGGWTTGIPSKYSFASPLPGAAAGSMSALDTRREHLTVQLEQGNSLATRTLGGYNGVSVVEEQVGMYLEVLHGIVGARYVCSNLKHH